MTTKESKSHKPMKKRRNIEQLHKMEAKTHAMPKGGEIKNQKHNK
jgi:hypothetical protein